jgi:BASS family bile acid:Na+ symporter
MDQFQDLGFIIGTSFIMLSLGLGLSPADFRRIAEQPRAYIAGLVFQVVVLPLTALALVRAWPVALSPEIVIGTMFLAAAPGGVTSNLLTRLAGGDTALSVCLTATTSLASALTVPVVVLLTLVIFGVPTKDIPSLWQIASTLFLLVAVPVCTGVLFRQFQDRLARRVEPVMRGLSLLLLVVLLLAAMLENGARLLEHSTQAALVAIALNLSMLTMAWIGARLVRVGRGQVIALSLECGLQSTPLAIALLLLMGFSREHIVPAAFYGGAMLVTGCALSAYLGFGSRQARNPGRVETER